MADLRTTTSVSCEKIFDHYVVHIFILGLDNAIHRYIIDHPNDVLQYNRDTKMHMHIDAVDCHTKYHDVDTV